MYMLHFFYGEDAANLPENQPLLQIFWQAEYYSVRALRQYGPSPMAVSSFLLLYYSLLLGFLGKITAAVPSLPFRP